MATYYGKKYKLLELRHLVKEQILSARIMLKSRLLSKPETNKSVFIAMIDGESFHGGMCDRFKGIVSLYAYCKNCNIPFRIKYTYPFKLEDYLLPSTYDWTIKEGEYTDNPLYSRVLYMRGEHLARRLLGLKTNRQIHFYTNRDLLDHINEYFIDREDLKWGELFKELFKPCKTLEETIHAIKAEIGNGYIAVVFRFQNLLGDFSEYHFKPLGSSDDMDKLINKCLVSIEDLKVKHPGRQFLITSDSTTFLKRAVELENVHIIPGLLVHMDGSKDNVRKDSSDLYLKSFVDFYMLGDADKIYRVGTSYMYPSEFPLYASKINDIPFESIII